MLYAVCAAAMLLSGCSGSDEQEADVDIDLTVMSATMVYSEVFNMLLTPEEYQGKTFLMDGLYSGYDDDVTGRHYSMCIIPDATACCSQGIEFLLTDEYEYPDDYPEEGDEITLTGVYDLYDDGEYEYYLLKDVRLVDE